MNPYCWNEQHGGYKKVFWECPECNKEIEERLKDAKPVGWLCLDCGHIGTDRDCPTHGCGRAIFSTLESLETVDWKKI
jgi:hypothetical protein